MQAIGSVRPTADGAAAVELLSDRTPQGRGQGQGQGQRQRQRQRQGQDEDKGQVGVSL